MLTLWDIMMFASRVGGGMRDSASFLDRSFIDCTFSANSSSLGLRQPSLKGKKETIVYYFTQNNMSLFHVLPVSLSEESAAALPLPWPGLPWSSWVCDTPHPLLGFVPVAALFCLVLVITGCLVISQLTFRLDIPPFSLYCTEKLIKDYIYFLSGTLAHIAFQWSSGTDASLHCPLTRDHHLKTWCYVHSLFFQVLFLDVIEQHRSLSGHSFIFLQS